jgi:Heat induced stress protein YflT
MKTITGVFSSMAELDRAVRDLERMGISQENISVIAGNEAERHQEYLDKSKEASTSTGAAAASGASFGGGMGIVASLVALAIPGVGPIVAGGAIATVIAGLGIGAASGGLIGALSNMGVSHEEAPLYEEAVRRGALILVAKVDEPVEREVVDLMRENGARDLEDVADTWRAAGWSGLKTDPHPYVSDSSIRGHEPPES